MLLLYLLILGNLGVQAAKEPIDDDIESDAVMIKESSTHTPQVVKRDTCNIEILKRFGLQGRGDVEARPSTEKDLDICHSNQRTCCDREDILAQSARLRKAAEKYNRFMGFVEELLSVFIGGLIYKIVLRLPRTEACEQRIIGFSTFKSSTFVKEKDCKTDQLLYKKFDFLWLFKCNRMDLINERAIELLQEFKAYSRTQLYLYGNVICSICNPREVSMFETNSEGETSLKMSLESMSQMLRNQLFETQLNDFLNNAALMMLTFIRCSDEERDKNSMNKISNLQKRDNDYEMNLRRMRECLLNFRESGDRCEELLSTQLTVFKFSYLDIKVVKEVLAGFYSQMNGHSIQKYYKRVKNDLFWLKDEKHLEIKKNEIKNDEITEVNFFPVPNGMEDNLGKLRYKLFDGGANPYFSFLTKEFWKDGPLTKQKEANSK